MCAAMQNNVQQNIITFVICLRRTHNFTALFENEIKVWKVFGFYCYHLYMLHWILVRMFPFIWNAAKLLLGFSMFFVECQLHVRMWISCKKMMQWNLNRTIVRHSIDTKKKYRKQMLRMLQIHKHAMTSKSRP